MNKANRYADLSDEQLQRVHAACETFEQALRNEQPIRIEDCLAAASEEIRSPCFVSFSPSTSSGKCAHDRPPQIAEYHARFPDRKDDIEAAFLELPTKASARGRPPREDRPLSDR